MSNYIETAEELLERFSKQREEMILGQLNALVSRGLLVWEEERTTLAMMPDTNEVKIVITGQLVLKNMEYVRQMEEENTRLKHIVESWKSVLDSIEAVKS